MQSIFRTLGLGLNIFREAKSSHHKCRLELRSYFLTTQNRGQGKPLSELALLRRKTGLPILKCKEALSRFESMEEAEAWLEEEARREGMQRVKLGRDANNGAVALCVMKPGSMVRATLIELNCETDHLALGEDFQKLTSNLCWLIADSSHQAGNLSVEEMLSVIDNEGLTISDLINSFAGKSKENTVLKRGVIYECGPEGFIGSYVHNYKSFPPTDMLLKVGTHASIVHVEGEGTDVQLCADQLAQHVVGVEQEAEGKVEVLLEHPWLFDPEVTVKSFLDSKQLNCVHLVRYDMKK